MKVFVIGVSGAVGGLLADELTARGDVVSGLVRREGQRTDLASRGVEAHVGDIGAITPDALASLLGGVDALVYAAGSNGGSRQVTDAVDGDGVVTALEGARLAGVTTFVLVSVLPEAWRERHLDEDQEHYFAVKKLTDVAVSLSDLDWLVLRPSMLVDRPGTGRVALGAAQPHDEIARADVAATLAELLHEPRIRRQVLELNQGEAPIPSAVRSVRPPAPGGRRPVHAPAAPRHGRPEEARMSVRFSHPDGLLQQAMYAPVALATGSRFLLLAGQVAVDPAGAPTATDVAGQVHAALGNVALAVRGAGGDVRDVARLTVYVVDWTPALAEELQEGISRAQESDGFTSPLPPTTVIGVQALWTPELRVEIEATAVLP